MRFYFADVLACPVCKASGEKLLIHPVEVEEAEPPEDIEALRCRNYCAYHRRPAQEVPIEECRKCSSKRIKTGVIVCLNCGRWYPILEYIPVMLDDEYIDLKLYRKFASKYLDRIPGSVRSLMKKPDPSSLLSDS